MLQAVRTLRMQVRTPMQCIVNVSVDMFLARVVTGLHTVCLIFAQCMLMVSRCLNLHRWNKEREVKQLWLKNC
nr:MAG TPA: hypothetical protein [Caudoviricetes sp.]